MIESKRAELKNKNTAILKITWAIFLIVITLSIIFLWPSISSINNNNNNIEVINKLNSFSKEVNVAGFELNQILLKNEEDLNKKDTEIYNELKLLDSNFEGLLVSLNNSMTDDFDENLIKKLKKNHSNFQSIAQLIADGNSGVMDNQVVFKSQFRNNLHAYENTLTDIRIMCLALIDESSNNSAITSVYFSILVLFFAILAYFGVLRPLTYSFNKNEELLTQYESKLTETKDQVISAIELQKESELKLKTKNAQVSKLQESLEESIKRISSFDHDKSMIYLNAATDLEGYLKVVNLQKGIIENQTSIAQNSSWRPLTSAISQLNSMVGDYFKKAKDGVNSQSQNEVYLSQLISEIILSTSSSDSSIFEQVSDMPSVKTNVELFKNVLLPYFSLVASVSNNKVHVSAVESGAVCEVKIVGLSNVAIKRILEIEQKKLVNLDFFEFKIHMAKNTIIERGGAVWTQDDVVSKGALCIRWVL